MTITHSVIFLASGLIGLNVIIILATDGNYYYTINYHFYRAMLAQSAVMRLLSSVRLSVCNDQVP